MGAVFVASLTMLDPELLQERMHPGGQPPPVGLKGLYDRAARAFHRRRP